MRSDSSLAVVYDADSALPLPRPRRLLRRLGSLWSISPRDRRTVYGMPGVLHRLVAAGAQVTYLTSAPARFEGRLPGWLERGGYPPGSLLVTSRGDDGRRRALERLLGRGPRFSWVLIGDDGEDAPELFVDIAGAHPDRVDAIALRTVATIGRSRKVDALAGDTSGVPVVVAPNGSELLAPLCAALGLPDRPRGTVESWLLTSAERGNDGSALRAWTSGNAVTALVHGSEYFPLLADTLGECGGGDLVVFAGWRGDADEQLTGDGHTVGTALEGAARAGAHVQGLLWRSHAQVLGYSAPQNRALAARVAAAGGRVLLDQRVRPLDSHHQKFVVRRSARRPATDVAFVGGIDLSHGRRDDARHAGDPQPDTTLSRRYGATPAWHDVQLRLQGPAVRDVEEVFRERWRDPALLSGVPFRRPWWRREVAADVPEASLTDDPPMAGSCSVQLLRTYPHRWPRYPFALRGERSIARGYAKALQRARELIYIEDQYLWSVDVARVFASALVRSTLLRLIAVVPRHPDQAGRFYTRSARLGHVGALEMVREAGGDRVQVLDLENHAGRPVYVHTKVCVIDDVWAAVGSDNFNRRSWTHDSELAAAVVDDERDLREPRDPGGAGDGARVFARNLRLRLMREHLDRDDDAGLLHPTEAADVVRRSAAALEAWHASDRRGPRPPGRLRPHRLPALASTSPRWVRTAVGLAYRAVLDPDGRAFFERLRRTY